MFPSQKDRRLNMDRPDIRKKQPSSWLLGLDALHKIKKDALTYYNDLHANFGDVVKVRLGPYRCWFLYHPDHIEQVLAKQGDCFIRFERIMNILRQWNGDSVLMAEGASWTDRRRKILPAFKQRGMPEYANMIIQYSNEFVDQLMNQEQSTYRCVIDAQMAHYALDIAGITLFSKKLGSESEQISHAVHELSEIAYEETTALFTLPDFFPRPAAFRKRRVISLIKNTITNIVHDRLQNDQHDHVDLLSILINHHEKGQHLIEEDVMSLLIAGHETSGATLSWLFLLLAKNQDVLAKVHEELDHVIPNGDFEYDHMLQLPYLTAVVEETLRLFPAAYGLFCRRATQDVRMSGFDIKKGDLVQLLPYVTQRDARWFENPADFNPERFISERSWPKYAYFPFGAGPRVCIGQSFGMMEIVLISAIILKNFTIAKEIIDLEALPRFSLRPAEDYEVSFCKR